MSKTGRLTDEIVHAAVEGEREALDTLSTEVSPQVRLMVAARLGAGALQSPVIEDISQLVCLGMTTNLGQLQNRSVGGFKAFLSTIVARRVADHLRGSGPLKPGPSRAASLDSTVAGLTSDGPLWQLLSADGTSPATAADRAEQFTRVLAALEQLKQEHRSAITYAFFDQLTTAEIAEKLSISRPAASMLLIRAVQALRRRLVPATPE